MKYLRPKHYLFYWLCCLLLLVATAKGAPAPENLFEYGYAAYGDDGLALLLPSPPFVKIYQDGVIVFQKEARFYTGRLDERQLGQLRSALESQPLLARSRYLPLTNGTLPGLHGGLCYIRYRSGRRQVIIAAGVIPESGAWQKLVTLVQGFFPAQLTLFYPEKVALGVRKTPEKCPQDDEGNAAWPAGKGVSLAASPQLMELSDPELIRYLFNRAYTGDSQGWHWRACEQEVMYAISLNKVAGWFNDEESLSVAAAQALPRKGKHKRRR